MVAISLYRGNLHKVSDAPRRWAPPSPSISLRQFRALLARRNRALSALKPPRPQGGDPNRLLHPPDLHQQSVTKQGGGSETVDRMEDAIAVDSEHVSTAGGGGGDGNVTEGRGKASGDEGEDEKNVGSGAKGDGHRAMEVENVETVIEEIGACDVISNREKRKGDLERKLKNLNKEKHHLVQMLKQILNAEEEIKRRHNMQAPLIHVPLVGQVEASANMGSMTRQTPQRMGSDLNPSGDSEGEPEDASNSHARSIHQMSITSPSADSLLATHSTRAGYTVSGYSQTSSWLANAAASPSRFTPSASQGHPTSLPPLSVSGMQFTASTPSPARSAGTPTFRDARLTSQSWSQR